MAQCNWDPKKHGGRPCPVHGGGGLWDENVFTRADKLKKAGYTDEDLKDEDVKEMFDDDYDEEFKPTSDDFLEELSDNDYYYGGLKEQDIYNLMAERLSKKYDTEITPEEVEKGLKDGGFSMDEYNKYVDGDGDDDKSQDEGYKLANGEVLTGEQALNEAFDDFYGYAQMLEDYEPNSKGWLRAKEQQDRAREYISKHWNNKDKYKKR